MEHRTIPVMNRSRKDSKEPFRTGVRENDPCAISGSVYLHQLRDSMPNGFREICDAIVNWTDSSFVPDYGYTCPIGKTLKRIARYLNEYSNYVNSI